MIPDQVQFRRSISKSDLSRILPYLNRLATRADPKAMRHFPQYSIFAIPKTSYVMGWMFTCHFNDCVKVGNVGDSEDQEQSDAWKKSDMLRAIEAVTWVGEWELAQPEAFYSNTTVFWQGYREFDVNMIFGDS